MANPVTLASNHFIEPQEVMAVHHETQAGREFAGSCKVADEKRLQRSLCYSRWCGRISRLAGLSLL